MHYIKSDSRDAHEALAARNWNGARTYFGVSYLHEGDDGKNWCAIVDALQKGETEIDEDEYFDMLQSNFDANLAYEQKRIEEAKAQITDETPALDVRSIMRADAEVNGGEIDGEKYDGWQRPTRAGVVTMAQVVEEAIVGPQPGFVTDFKIA